MVLPENENINSITEPAIKRLAKEAGVKRLSKRSHDYIRSYMINFLHSVIEKCIIFAQSDKRRTLAEKDIIATLEFMGRGYALGEDFSYKKKKTATATQKKSSKKGKDKNKFFMACKPFENLVRLIGNNIAKERPYAKDFLLVLQIITVIHLIELLKKANFVAENSSRPTLMVEDIKLVQRIEDA